MSQVSELPYDQRPANRDLSHMPGDYGLPFVGKTWDIFRDPHKLFDRHYEKYGAISRISITGSKCVLLLDPEYAQRVLMDREKNFSTKMGWQSVMADFFQGGLVMRDYDEHRMHRGIMQSSFKPPAMRAYANENSGHRREDRSALGRPGPHLVLRRSEALVVGHRVRGLLLGR